MQSFVSSLVIAMFLFSPPAASNSTLDLEAIVMSGHSSDDSKSDSIKKVGGAVLPPTVISSVEPKYPRPLFHRPKSSAVIVGLTVTPTGSPDNVHIVRSGGGSFDKSAIEAVRQYRFHPATENGTPVAVELNVEVNFRIF